MKWLSSVFISVPLLILLVGCGAKKPTQPMANTAVPAVNSANQNASVNDSTNTTTNQPITLQGKVFVKGYKTPSESYGILTSDGLEIGLGKYDSAKEQFRPYVGDQVSVTFSSICQSGEGSCCRTIFSYCGTVSTWKPITQ